MTDIVLMEHSTSTWRVWSCESSYHCFIHSLIKIQGVHGRAVCCQVLDDEARVTTTLARENHSNSTRRHEAVCCTGILCTKQPGGKPRFSVAFISSFYFSLGTHFSCSRLVSIRKVPSSTAVLETAARLLRPPTRFSQGRRNPTSSPRNWSRSVNAKKLQTSY